MTQVKLMGEMGQKFGENWSSADSSIRDILKLIECQTEGLADFLAECHQKNIQFSIQKGKDLIEEFPELYLNTNVDEIIITPVPAGSGKGLGKVIAGLLLLAALFFLPGTAALFTSSAGAGGGAAAAAGAGASTVGGAFAAGQVSAFTAMQYGATLSLNWGGMAVAMLGTNLALAGLMQMSAPDPDDTTDDPSYLFNGAENHIEQGQPVPLLYGEMTIGGSVIHQGFAPGINRSGNTSNRSRQASGPRGATGGGGITGTQQQTYIPDEYIDYSNYDLIAEFKDIVTGI